MTVQINSDNFAEVKNVDPGGGFAYYYYAGTVSDNYEVSLSSQGPDVTTNYFVFSLSSLQDEFNDTFFVGMPGTYEAGAGDDVMVSTQSPDDFYGNPGPTRFFGGSGDDSINPADQADLGDLYVIEAYGGIGDDTINGSQLDDTLYGDHANSFTGYPVIASFQPGPYDTNLDGDDLINGYEGDDTISGGGGDDQLLGGDGADTLTGGDGSDFLFGGPRGTGNLDILTGGSGADSFLLSYNQDAGGSGGAFWSAYFAQSAEDIAGNAVNSIVADAIKNAIDDSTAVAAGFIADGLGAGAGQLVTAFIDLVEALTASPTPQTKQDVMVVADFDPREDVLILPLPTTVIQGLTVETTTASAIPGIADGEQILQFYNGDDTYAYVALGQDFLTDMGLSGKGDATADILDNVKNFPSSIAGSGGTVGFSNLVSPAISSQLANGGFVPQDGNLPDGSNVLLYGAIGGQVIANGESGDTFGSILAGTNYADALTTNPYLVDPAQTMKFNKSAALIHGFGGDDLVYGTNQPDTLFGDLGNDTLYSFLSSNNSDTNGINRESLSGGEGDDVLYGGGTAGDFDGADGSDTFGVLYSTGNDVLQLQVDLTTGQAAEQGQPLDITAPVGDTAPFSFSVRNNYTLTGIENAIGGPFNDWLKAASGSILEGAAGADYLDAKAGKVTLSYASSAAGVSVQVYADSVVNGGGDAAGDVVGFTGQTDIPALVGSDQADILGLGLALGLADGRPTFTGNGGSDRFQILSLPDGAPGIFGITDFDGTSAEADLIDLTPLGITAIGGVQSFGAGLWVVSAVDGSFLLEIVLPNFEDTLSASDFLLAEQASGRAVAPRDGGGLVGGRLDDTVLGRGGGDFLFGKGGDDLLQGRVGNDALHGGIGADRLFGGDGQDRLDGNAGRDLVFGGAGDDRVTGGRGQDRLFGGTGDDVLHGGSGADRLDGGLGGDTLRGDRGADTFRLRFGELEGDVIADFARGQGDRLLVVADTAVSVIDQGGGVFVLTDGTVSETLTASGAVAADFLL